jgi:hypothetical protein
MERVRIFKCPYCHKNFEIPYYSPTILIEVKCWYCHKEIQIQYPGIYGPGRSYNGYIRV